MTKKVKNTVPCIYVIINVNGEESVAIFYEEFRIKEFRIEKVIKKKGDKLYVKWKRYDSFFNSWIDKKDII